jgi:beta-lactamase class D
MSEVVMFKTIGIAMTCFLSGLAAAAAQQTARSAPPRRECVMLQALDGSAPIVSDAAECAVRSAPASTFKIPHALIALDTGVLSAQESVGWDGTKQPFAAWERDRSLDSAMKASVVWVFRRTATLIGRDRMIDYLNRLEYAGDTFERDLTSFWLNGDLVVSPEEQLRFMRRFARYELPVRRQHIDTVMSALLMPRGSIQNASGTHAFALAWSEPLVVRAKTGNATVGTERVSWLVGHLESGDRQYVFASRVRAGGSLPGTAGADLALEVLNAHRPEQP